MTTSRRADTDSSTYPCADDTTHEPGVRSGSNATEVPGARSAISCASHVRKSAGMSCENFTTTASRSAERFDSFACERDVERWIRR